ncbi:MAG: hypothetical protein Q4D91_03405 [Lautropia sp.]|nr:hypothetical protein [Lautropia sp.]
MNLLLLTFGDKVENHYQAVFAILSFLKSPAIERAIVITDRPDFYRFLAERVDVVTIDQQTLSEWKAPYQFFWRIKIKAVALAVARYPDQHLMYVDSDTFLAGDLGQMVSALDAGGGYMHLFEEGLGSNTNRTLKRMYQSLAGKTFAGVTMTANTPMWNAGVIALPASRAAETVQLALQLCDEMCATDCTRRLIEQFAFSVALHEKTQLAGCENIIGHYWGNKPEWDAFITQFFATNLLKGATLADCIEQMRTINWKRLPLEKRKRSSTERIKRWLDGTFKPRRVRYFQGDSP